MLNKQKLNIILLFSLSLLTACNITSDYGTDEWHQYRMSETKNAVYDNGEDPLESTVFETSSEIRATPVIAKDKLFIGNHGTGDLFAFDIHTGKEIWQNQAPNWVHSEMIFHDDKVFVGTGNRMFQENGIRGTGESGVLALNADDGEIIWKFNTDGEVMPTPVYYNNAIYAATDDRHLYKLDADTGEFLDKVDIGSTISMSSPNLSDDTLFVGGSGPLPYTFTAYDLLTDELKWQTPFEDVVSGLDDVPPAVFDNKVVTTALEEAESEGDPKLYDHMIYAMDTETGEVLWEERLGTGAGVANNKSGAPMIYEGKIYVGSPVTKTFYAYELKTGQKIWEFENQPIKAPPVAKDGIVYFSNVKGEVYALNAKTGDVIAKKELGGILAPAGPVIVNETLFIGSQDSNVYAVPLEEFMSE